eukprot:1158192-Pelagomonas_calceolata.AAC.4
MQQELERSWRGEALALTWWLQAFDDDGRRHCEKRCIRMVVVHEGLVSWVLHTDKGHHGFIMCLFQRQIFQARGKGVCVDGEQYPCCVCGLQLAQLEPDKEPQEVRAVEMRGPFYNQFAFCTRAELVLFPPSHVER